VIEGRVWGALIAGTDEPQPLPPGSELRLASFAELIATAVSNATARSGLRDRVAALDGTLTVDSPPGAGTRIRAEIPLRPGKSSKQAGSAGAAPRAHAERGGGPEAP
jgi:hypothetical protein